VSSQVNALVLSQLHRPHCRLAKAQHIRVVEAHVFPLLRLCFNCMRAHWRPGGYPPTADAHALVPGTRCHRKLGFRV
jgi:hypothetical protein